MLAIRAYLLVDFQVNAEATPDSFPPAHGTRPFGGPIALAGYMHGDLVAERGWYSDDEYQQGLAIAQTMPGPPAAQLAMWLGYLERGARGALLVALPFVVPPFVPGPRSRRCTPTRGCRRWRASSSASARR